MTCLIFRIMPLYLLSLIFLSFSSHTEHGGKPSTQLINIGLIEELAPYSFHPVSTKEPQAQRFFDQGLVFLYGFNHSAAYQSFAQAAKLDPEMPMAYWGMALALGPVLGTEISEEEHKQAYQAIQQALRLAPNATESERAYIEALAQRYSNQPNPSNKQLADRYKKAMQKVHEKYPDDLDAASLYALSFLCLNSDKLWQVDGKPEKGTEELVQMVEDILKKDPTHIGANHYYIHILEASRNPRKALISADVLETVPPVLTHLAHMPSHIYILLGDYEGSIRINERAVKGDYAYIKKFGENNDYALASLGHNLTFLIRSYVMAGRYEDAKKSAKELRIFFAPYFEQKPGMEMYYSLPYFVLLRFNDWAGILREPKPPAALKVSTLMWHFARAAAYAAQGQEALALEEQKLFQEGQKELPADSKYGEKPFEPIAKVLNYFLEGKIAGLQGNKSLEIEAFQKAVALQDSMGYEGPLNWLFFVREDLGNALLRDRQYKEAEAVFRQDLDQHPLNGRSLFGLWQSLKGQSRATDAFWIQRAYERAWKSSDVSLDNS